jgi:hypothetical protein
MKQIDKLKGVWGRWNWGKGIVLVYSLFVLGILFLVYQSKQQKLDLVYDDYYAQELMFQNQTSCEQSLQTMTYWLKFNQFKIEGKCVKK